MRKTVHILLPVVFLLTIVLCALFAAGKMLSPTAVEAVASTSFSLAEKGRGLVLAEGKADCFPSKPGMNRQEQQAELDALLDYAAQNGFEAVYYRAVNKQTAYYCSKILPAGTEWSDGLHWYDFFDPLTYLCKQAANRGLEVFALTDSGDAALCAELAVYPLSGVVVTEAQLAFEQLPAAAAAMAEVSPHCKLGIVVEHSSNHLKIAARLAREGTVGLVHAIITAQGENFAPCLEEWSNAFSATDAKLVLWQNPYLTEGQQSLDQMGYRLLEAALNPDVTGAVFSDIGWLRQQPNAQTLLSFWGQAEPIPEIDLSFRQELGIYAPAEETIWLNNSYTTYFISGTSDPTLPLTLNGEELERTATNGVWGKLVDLKLGKNTFTLAQNGQTATVTVQVYNPYNAVPAAIDRVTEASRFPTGDRVYWSGDVINFTCVAPSGSRVVARIGSQNIPMTQRAATALPGIPATFGASYTIPAANDDEVVDLGKVSYILTQNGVASTFQSEGRLYAAGQQANIVAQVGQYMTALYNAPTGDGNIAANLNPGTRLALRGEYQNGRALLQDMDLYVPLADVTILTGRQESRQHYEFFELRKSGKGEELVLGSGLNAAFPTYENGLLTVTLADTVVENADNGLTLFETAPEDLDKSNVAPFSDLFSSITAQNNEDGSATFRLQLLPGVALAGWDTYINGDGQAVLYCQKLPTILADSSRPLEGITIMVDPGHGGEDPGAPGAAGAGGPNEAQVNLALSHMLRFRLQQLGATVVMTQQDNSRITIQERYLLAQQTRPDLYISVHHNSLAEWRDANQVFYTTGYYFYPQSAQLAKAAVAEVSRRADRDAVEASYAAYYVTRMTLAPSILFETGFVSNPLEQQQCCDRYTILKTACGLADAIVQAFESPLK